MGCNVGTICGLPFGDYQKPEHLKILSDDIEKAPFRHIIIITANKYQKKSFDILDKHGFRAVFEFLSAHDNHTETLTVWVKTNEEIDKTPILNVGFNGYNCSVAFNSYEVSERRCLICMKDTKDKKDMPPGFKRIKNTPIWFYIDEKHVIKKKGKK